MNKEIVVRIADCLCFVYYDKKMRKVDKLIYSHCCWDLALVW